MRLIYAWDDPADRWFAADKVEHLVGGLAAYLLALRVTDGVWPWVLVFGAGLLVEAIEVVRYRAWVRRLRPQPWPWLTDLVSPKDLVVDMVGAAVGALAVWLLR